jgi:hypothetical protein
MKINVTNVITVIFLATSALALYASIKMLIVTKYQYNISRAINATCVKLGLSSEYIRSKKRKARLIFILCTLSSFFALVGLVAGIYISVSMFKIATNTMFLIANLVLVYSTMLRLKMLKAGDDN